MNCWALLLLSIDADLLELHADGDGSTLHFKGHKPVFVPADVKVSLNGERSSVEGLVDLRKRIEDRHRGNWPWRTLIPHRAYITDRSVLVRINA